MGGRNLCAHKRARLKENRIYAKKKTLGYREPDQVKRQAFLQELDTLAPENIVDADEAGMDNRDDYAKGWNERGERFHAFKSGNRQGRVNMIAGCNQQLMATFTVEGACNRYVFELWLEIGLIPLLKAGQVLVIRPLA